MRDACGADSDTPASHPYHTGERLPHHAHHRAGFLSVLLALLEAPRRPSHLGVVLDAGGSAWGAKNFRRASCASSPPRSCLYAHHTGQPGDQQLPPEWTPAIHQVG
jgi:hypothetical protein